ncbi:MAG: DegT/DnrJ/EryC1/StrS family aminotransferase [Clostridia bacterium]
MRTTFLDYNRPDVTDREVSAVVDAVRSYWLTRGPRVGQFEQALRTFIGQPNLVVMNSCTAALHLALVAAGIGPGDEVITTPLTFAASVNVILHVGATPVLADVHPETGLLDVDAVRAAITPRTRAVLPVDYAGFAVDLDAFRELCKSRDLVLVEDAAHAIATRYKGRLVGSYDHFAAFSFYATKNLATGEGGALSCPTPEMAERVRLLSSHGMSKNAWSRYTEAGSWYYEIHEAGYKYNMTDLQAALGLVQLERLHALQDRRAEIARAFNDAFAQDPALVPPVTPPDVEPAWHIYPLRIREQALTINRDRFFEELKARQIGCSVHFIPIHFHPYYHERFGWPEGSYPNAEAYFRGEISLPLYPGMSDQDVADVVEAVRGVAAEHRA